MTGTSARLLSLLSLLQVRRDWSGPLLADRLAVSERTVRRDVDRLRELGYRVRAVKGPDGGYRLDAGSELPPLLFDEEQAVALAVALRNAVAAGAGVEEAAARALTTVRQVMPARLRQRIDALQVTPVPPGSRSPAVDVDVLLALSGAVRAREVLRFDYADPRGSSEPGPVPPRRAEPHHVVARAGRWYLVAWDLDRAGWRTFRVDRISPRMPTGPRFTPRELPGGDVATFVAARFKGSEARDEWPCRGEAVLGCAAADVAPYVGEEAVDDLGPGRCRVRLGAWSWPGLAAHLCALDAEVEAVAPPALADAFALLARRCAAVAG